MKTTLVRSVLATLLLSALASAQGAWQQAATSGPSARIGHAMAYDSVRGRTVLFGGTTGGTVHGDTWEWDGNNWTQVAAVGPTPRLFSAMTFDSVRGRIVLFGGWSGGPQGDTWEWDGTSWLPQFFATGPTARSSHQMAFDSVRGRTVLFGGAGAAPLSSYQATWEWDGNTWTQTATTGAPGRDSFAMAFDAARGRTVLLGGRSVPGSAVIDDTWEWDGASWSQSIAGPMPRVYHALAFDGASVVVFGGGPGGVLTDFRQLTAGNWTQMAQVGPTARMQHAMAFDSLRGKVVLFGGSLGTANSELGDTWEWSRAGVPTAASYGAGCGIPALSLWAEPSALPHLNSTAQVSISHVPTPLVFVALGLSNTLFNAIPLPVTLASIGMPGCSLLQSANVVGEPATSSGSGTASYGFAIPNNSALVGMHLYLQGWAWAPGANPANIIVSNGLDWRVGY